MTIISHFVILHNQKVCIWRFSSFCTISFGDKYKKGTKQILTPFCAFYFIITLIFATNVLKMIKLYDSPALFLCTDNISEIHKWNHCSFALLWILFLFLYKLDRFSCVCSSLHTPECYFTLIFFTLLQADHCLSKEAARTRI